jgi:1-acyl-sn-glycerol-3-phosphate acyltransferase
MLVDRQSPDRAGILRHAARLVERGLSLIVFPEGTRSLDGHVGRFKGGSFVLAIEAGLPIVPLSISGSRHVMRKGRLMTCPGVVRLCVHEPIPAAPSAPADVVQKARALADRVRSVVMSGVDTQAEERS